MVDKVHAVIPVDNNNVFNFSKPFPSHKFNLLNVWVAAKKRKTHPLSNADKKRIHRIRIVLIKTHFVALDPPPGDAHGFL